MEDRQASDARRWPRRRSRRSVLHGLVGGSGALVVLPALGALGKRPALARSDDGDDGGRGGDDSGSGGNGTSGRGGGRGDDSRREGEADTTAEEAEAAPIVGEVPAGAIEVRIVADDAGGFVPADLTVDAGQTVAFVNAHDDPHTATGSGFDTGIIQPGQVATVVLAEPGSFAYACRIHPVMTGRIGVRGTDGSVPPPAQAAAPPAGATVVSIANFAFAPASVTVPIGATVAWTNDDGVPHTATALDGAFDSGIFDPGAAFSWTFAAPGTFPYRCNLHPQMQGTVVVAGAAPAAVATDEGSLPPAAPDDGLPAADAAAAPVEAGAAGGAGGALVGTWRVLLSPDAGSSLLPQQGIVSFRGDGTLEAVFAPSGGEPTLVLSPAHGEWETAAADRYALAFVALIRDAGQRFAGTLEIQETGMLDGEGLGYRGTFTYTATDANGGVVADGGGTTRGTRVALAVAAPSAAATPAATTGAPAAVAIRDLAFDPAALAVAVGTTATWTNEDAVPHTVTADDGSFDSGRLDQAQTFSMTFDQPGTIAYACAFHPGMRGSITVS